MATSQTCCHLPGEMLNSAPECADRARISGLHSQQKSALEVNPAPSIATRSKLLKKRFYLELDKFEEIQ
jgi:hypothetical protein